MGYAAESRRSAAIRAPARVGVPAAMVAAACLLLPSDAVAQPGDIPPIQEARLDNGLRILVLEDHSQPRVACKILTHMGSLQDEPGRLGAAHFLEHIMYKGSSATVGSLDWEKERLLLERIGELEREILQERNRARRELRQRGVFLDYQHQTTTPRLDALETQLEEVVDEQQQYIVNSELMSYHQRNGGTRLTAQTEQEYMHFDINLPTNKLEMFFRVEADRMVNTQFRQFDAEKMILWEQRLGDLNRPDTEFREMLVSASGAISPIYWNEGYPTDFDLLDRQFTRALYESRFVPNNTILVFVGDTTVARVEPLARQYFGRIPRGPETSDTLAIEPVHKELIRVETTLPHYGPAIDLRHRIPGVGHPDHPAVELLEEILGDRHGPVGEATVGVGLATAISANSRVTHTDRFSFPSTLNLMVHGRSNDGMPELETAVVAAIEDLMQTPIDDAVIAAAKKRRRAAWERRRLDWDGVAFDLGHYEIMDSWRTLFRERNAMQAVTAADLQAVASKYFLRTNRIVGVALREIEETANEER